MALLSIAALCLGQSCSSPSAAGTGGTAGPGGAGGSAGTGGSAGAGGGTFAPVEGIYAERFSCKLDDGTCLETDVRIEMRVTDLGGRQYEIDDLGSNALATGMLTGNILGWSSTDPDFPGFSENGTWDFSDSTTFVKESTFMQDQGSMGSCVGSGRLASEGEPAAPPPFMTPCTP